MKTLEETLEELTPTPDPDFVEEMERRMEMGFPPAGKPLFALPKLTARPALAVAAVGLVSLVTVVALTNEEESARDDGGAVNSFLSGDDGGSAGGAVPEPAPATAPNRQRQADLADADMQELRIAQSPPPRRIGEVAPGRRDRQVERSASLALASDPDDFDEVADSIFAITARRGGFVLNSSFTQAEKGIGTGFFDLRVPVAELQPTLNALSRLATVRSRSESGNDVTGRFVAVGDRLRIARAERKSLLTRLENATTDLAAQAIRRRLEIVAAEINGLRGRLARMRERTTFAAVSVELVDKSSGAAAEKGKTREAFDDALGSLEDIAHFLIRALGILIPLGAVALVGWFAGSRARRRARERALA